MPPWARKGNFSMKPEYLLNEVDRAEITKRLKRLGFANISWKDHTVRATHPKDKYRGITEAIRALGFHVGSGGIAIDAYACVFSRAYQQAFRCAWDEV